MDLELIFRYYGVDWIAVVFTMVAIIKLGSKKKSGFVLMMVGNMAWIAFGIISRSAATIVANVVFLGLNLRGLIRWTKE